MNTIQDNANITHTIEEVDKNDYYNLPTQEEKENNEQNEPNYGRTKGLYSEKLLKLQRRQHFITIPQSTQIVTGKLKKGKQRYKIRMRSKGKAREWRGTLPYITNGYGRNTNSANT